MAAAFNICNFCVCGRYQMSKQSTVTSQFNAPLVCQCQYQPYFSRLSALVWKWIAMVTRTSKCHLAEVLQQNKIMIVLLCTLLGFTFSSLIFVENLLLQISWVFTHVWLPVFSGGGGRVPRAGSCWGAGAARPVWGVWRLRGGDRRLEQLPVRHQARQARTHLPRSHTGHY